MSDFKNISDFRKSKSSKYSYQDPTYLSFLLMFDFHDNANSPLLSGAAENFIEKLGPQYSDSLKALKDFIKSLKIINNELPWYWQSISGLDRIQKYQPENPYMGGDEAMITISTLESLNLLKKLHSILKNGIIFFLLILENLEYTCMCLK